MSSFSDDDVVKFSECSFGDCTESKIRNRIDYFCRLRAGVLDDNPELNKLYQRWLKRKPGDKKIPPGSATVIRSVKNVRFMLSLTCIDIGRCYELVNGPEALLQCICYYRESLMWYPGSVEGGYMLGKHLRHRVCSISELSDVEETWTKAVASLLAMGYPNPVSWTDDPNCSPYESSLNSLIIHRERESGKSLVGALALHHCQQGNIQLAGPLLVAEGFKYKLSQRILCYDLNDSTGHRADEALLPAHAVGIDQFLPMPLLRRLQFVFRPEAPYWSEHDYDFYNNASRKAGYFSYLYPFREQSSPSNVVEQTIDLVFARMSLRFPELAAEATVAEWWVHTRPHSCGHQFHFDSDETALCAGQQAQHPIVTTIIYLSTVESGEDECIIGGPTVVTNQTLQSECLASEGFMFLPKQNRMITFDAKYLHGVIPGRGVCSAPPDRRRLSLMVGFWRKIQAKTLEDGSAGAGQPYPSVCQAVAAADDAMVEVEPPASSSRIPCTWPLEMGTIYLSEADKTAGVSICPTYIPVVWENVAGNEVTPSTDTSTAPIRAPYESCFQGF